jgi:hypothetical protein
MNPVRISVVPRGKGYIARAGEPNITALGKTPLDAAESARRMAETILGNEARRAMLLLRIDEPQVSTFVMQPLSRAVALDTKRTDREWHYVASVTHDDSQTKLHVTGPRL